MILLPNRDLSQSSLDFLAERQNRVDEQLTLENKADLARKLFKSKQNKCFDEIRSTLTEMCNGIKRCNYCEDSEADEVEHIRPLKLYPEFCFHWSNYCYACGICNPKKNDHYAFVIEQDGKYCTIDANEYYKNNGLEAFINPRTENPLDFLKLEMINQTFLFEPTPKLEPLEILRAEYTIRLLRLNRTVLVESRERDYEGFLTRLEKYAFQKDKVSPDVLANMKRLLLKSSHITVWHEMKRQKDYIVQLQELFTQVPEALTW